jgi:hypothetical protein
MAIIRLRNGNSTAAAGRRGEAFCTGATEEKRTKHENGKEVQCQKGKAVRRMYVCEGNDGFGYED